MTQILSPLFKTTLALSASALMLAACGSSGGTSNIPVVIAPPPAGVDTSYTPGVFAPEGNFSGQCAVPRTGTDPATGNPFVDKAGSTLIENHWLRSWSNRTYLWYSEITDANPASTPDRLDYFELLKTNATTPSGAQKDKFHFTQDTAERYERVSTGASASLGARYAIISSRPPRDVRVAYTQSPSPLGDQNVARGAKFLEVDGVDIVNGATQADVDVINGALFPSDVGQTHTFLIEDTPGATPRSVTVTSTTVISDPVLLSNVIDQGSDKVGYVLFNTFGTSTAEQRLFDTFTTMESAGITDLVLDLRYNGGGFLDIAAELGYMIAGTNTASQTFELIEFNDKYPTRNPITNAVISPTPFYSNARGFTVSQGTALPTTNLNRVYILSTRSTCSASEALINGLRGIDVDVVLIGNTTCGKPYGFYTTDNCGVSYSTIQLKGSNAKGFGDYGDGFSPGLSGQTVSGELVNGCVIPDDYTAQLGDTNEAMLSAALTHRSTGACPVPTGQQLKDVADLAQKQTQMDGLSLTDSAVYQRELFYRQRTMRDTPPTVNGGFSENSLKGSE